MTKRTRAPEGEGPVISVIMAVYNGAPYVRHAIDSVLQQDCSNLEFVIVDDFSTDSTPSIIREYNDPRIVYRRNATNMGQTASLNVALTLARGPLIGRIDADDTHCIGKLRRQVEFMDAHPDVAVCGTWAVRVDGGGKTIGWYSPPVKPLDVKFRLLRDVPVCHVSVVMRRRAILQVGGYSERYKFAADYALWSAIVKAGWNITNIPERLTHFRESPITFGATQKLGQGAEECAQIISENARYLSETDLTIERARHIALLYFPEARLSATAICKAYLDLKSMAARIYGRLPMTVCVDLASILFWSLLKRSVSLTDRSSVRAVVGDLRIVTRDFLRHPDVVLVALAASVFVVFGEKNASRMKTVMSRMLTRLLSPTGTG